MMVIWGCEKSEPRPSETVTDIDGNVYPVITIGEQTWMAENLRVTRYRNGDTISTTFSPTEDISFEDQPEYHWAYNGIESNAAIYGRLYTWYVVNDTCGLCPQGWHIPSDIEWKTLTDYVGGESQAQKELKALGFTAEYAGWRPSWEFLDKDLYGKWWSTTPVGDEEPGAVDQFYCRIITVNADNINRGYHYSKSGLSVRCVKN